MKQRERSARINGHRRQNGEYDLVEIFIDKGVLFFVKLLYLFNVYAVFAKNRQDRVIQAAVLLFGKLVYFFRKARILLLRSKPRKVDLLRAVLYLIYNSRDSDHDKFIEV